LMLAAVSIATFAHGGMGVAAADGGNAGAVYTLTNAASGNGVTVLSRARDGTLTATGTVLTGGLGSGAGLGSQGGLTLSDDHEWMFAVNARSNEISILAVRPNGLTLVDKVASGGVLPISVTNYQDRVYALNAGSSGNAAASGSAST
jgi:6-phosphogluconolactonase